MREVLYVGDFIPKPLSGDAPVGVLLSKAIIYTIPSERKTNTNIISSKVLGRGSGGSPFVKRGSPGHSPVS